MKKLNVFLTFCVIILAAACFASIYGPEHFRKEQARREKTVKSYLVKIRAAEERYRRAEGVYTGSFGELTSKGYLADSLQFIPFSGGKRFDITATTQTSKTGKAIPLMECCAPYREYLKGLDKMSIEQATEDANLSGRYPGLKIGDINAPNDNAGNWE